MKLDLSIVVPVYNEEKILEKSIRHFVKYFSANRKIGRFEIVIAENGSSDKTLSIAKTLAERDNKVRLVKVGEKSLGRALTIGIKEACFPYVYFNAIDNPFEFADFEKFLIKIAYNDLVFASKNHREAIYISKFSRKLASRVLSLLNRLLFAIPLTDTQGTFMGKRQNLLKILPFCTANGAFFQIQLAIYAIQQNLKVTEVPVSFSSSGKKSNFSLVKDGFLLFGDLVKEKIKLFSSKLP